MSEDISSEYAELYEDAPCGLLSIALDGRILRLNATLSGWLGLPAHSYIGRRLHELLTIGGRVYYETHLAPLLRMQGFINEIALDLATADGGHLPIIANAVEKRDPEGGHVETRFAVLKAIERRRYERNLVDARKIAEDTTRRVEASEFAAGTRLKDEQEQAELRDQFIAVLGHDLRNPLAAISSGLTLLGRETLSERGERVVALMRGSLARAGELIDNVMDFARGRLGGGISVQMNADEPLAPVLTQVIDELRASSPDREIIANLAVDETVVCDRARIAQLVSNLLGNALTHGAPSTAIRVHAGIEDDWLEIWIANSGKPIPEEAVERLFQPFFRGEARSSRQGLGLGLHIAAEVARAHNGLLTVSSSEAETRFTFRMPRSRVLP